MMKRDAFILEKQDYVGMLMIITMIMKNYDEKAADANYNEKYDDDREYDENLSPSRFSVEKETTRREKPESGASKAVTVRQSDNPVLKT